MNKLMTRIVVGCLGLAACATAGGAGALTLEVGAPRTNDILTSVPLTVTNSGRRPRDKVAVTCAFFDAEGRQLIVGRAYMPAIAPGGSATESVNVQNDLGAVARHDCKVD